MNERTMNMLERNDDMEKLRSDNLNFRVMVEAMNGRNTVTINKYIHGFLFSLIVSSFFDGWMICKLFN